jgi:glutamyl-tRNA reductase
VIYIVDVALLGLNHQTAPLALREGFAVPAGGLVPLLAQLHTLPVAEAVLLSTCNRTELYILAADPAAVRPALIHYLCQMPGAPAGLHPKDLAPHLYWHTGEAAVRHLFRVAAGLDSMVIGETQILGQVREAYRAATEANLIGKTFHQLFTGAITAGKRAQHETRIGQTAVSVSYAAVDLAKKVFHSLKGRRALAVGAGETAKLTVKHLQAAGVGSILIANRTLARAESLADMIDGEAIPLTDVAKRLHEVDVVIASTGAPGYVLTADAVAEAIRARRGRPIFFFDIAVPRDIDPAIGQFEGAFVYDLDDLQAVVKANMAERMAEAKEAERIVADEVQKFQAWLQDQAVVPTIRALREKVEQLRQEELARALGRLPDLSERERQVIEAMTVTLVNKILNDPTQALKGLARDERAESVAGLVAELFKLPAPEVTGGGGR